MIHVHEDRLPLTRSPGRLHLPKPSDLHPRHAISGHRRLGGALQSPWPTRLPSDHAREAGQSYLQLLYSHMHTIHAMDHSRPAVRASSLPYISVCQLLAPVPVRWPPQSSLVRVWNCCSFNTYLSPCMHASPARPPFARLILDSSVTKGKDGRWVHRRTPQQLPHASLHTAGKWVSELPLVLGPTL